MSDGPTPDEVVAVARGYWGPENPKLSSKDELRWGTKGSKSLVIARRVWSDYETGESGGYLELYKMAGVPLPNGDGVHPDYAIIYDYKDETGAVRFQVVRYRDRTGKKQIYQRRPDGSGWINHLHDGTLAKKRVVPWLLYRLPELIASHPDEALWIPEGEKAVDNTRGLGLVATCSSGGAGSWLDRKGRPRPEYIEYCRGKHCITLPDNDDAGRAHASDIERSLQGIAASVVRLALPGLKPKGDISDWVAAGGTRDELLELYRKAQDVPASEPTFAVIDPGDWQGKPVPELRWIVPAWIPWGRVFGLYGAGGEGKTTLCQQLQTATALSQPWIGLHANGVKSLGVYCEDDEDDLHRRQEDINKLYGCDYADLRGKMRMLARLGYDNMLMTFENGVGKVTPFWEEILAEAINFGAQLIIFDTIADGFGGDEIDRSQVRQFVQVALGGWARQSDGAVLATAHPSKSGMSDGSGSSGSTGWDAGFRTRAYFKRPKTDDGEEADPFARVLQRVKANYAPRDETLDLRWSQGVFINTKPQGIIGSIEKKKCRRVFLDLLTATTMDGRPVSHKVHSSTYAPRLFALRPDREGYRQADFKRAMEELFAAKEIKIVVYKGVDRQNYECIVINDVSAGGAGGSQ